MPVGAKLEKRREDKIRENNDEAWAQNERSCRVQQQQAVLWLHQSPQARARTRQHCFYSCCTVLVCFAAVGRSDGRTGRKQGVPLSRRHHITTQQQKVDIDPSSHLCRRTYPVRSSRRLVGMEWTALQVLTGRVFETRGHGGGGGSKVMSTIIKRHHLSQSVQGVRGQD